MEMTRRLSAVMFTDIAGYTALAQRDEAAALQLVREQEQLLRPLLVRYHGRLVKSTGDGLLVEFESAREATQCAVEAQEVVHERNDRSELVPLSVRIGIHLGDVESRGDDILGDAVNLAARIESVAPSGEVWVSQQVLDQIRNKVPYTIESAGTHALKGVDQPVEVYRILPLRLAKGPRPPGPTRLAVLPFANFSSDPEDGFFADGLTEELITLLAQLKEIRVIARTSAFQYRSSPKSISQIGNELGVSSILEGSVRKARDQIRVTAQLIDVPTQEHLWASTYDRKLDDVFAVQSEVARSVAQALRVTMRENEVGRLQAGTQVVPESYLAYLKGLTLLSSVHTEENLVRAKEQFEKALALDASNARAHSGLADTASYLHWAHFESTREDWNRLRKSHAVRAIELDPGLAEAHSSLASILWDDFEFDSAEKELRLALTINPSYALAHHQYAALLEDEGRADDALRESELAVESDPQSVLTLGGLAMLKCRLRRLDGVPELLERIRVLDREGTAYYDYLAVYRLLAGDFTGALEAYEREEQLEPGRSWDLPIWISVARGDREHARDLLRKVEGSLKRPNPTMMAQAHAVVGDLDGCFRWLERGLAEHAVALQRIRMEPTLEPVMKDPRFAEILRRMNLGSTFKPPQKGD